jgi:hypothetical protein
MSSVAEVVNSGRSSLHFWKDEVGAIRLLGPVTYHLLSAPRPFEAATYDDPHVTIVGEIVRLTCLVLLSGLKKRFSLNALDKEPLLANLLNVTVQLPRGLDMELESLTLWALTTSALLQSSHERAYLLPHITSCGRNQNLSDARASIKFARSLLWVDVLEDDEELRLAEEIKRRWDWS